MNALPKVPPVAGGERPAAHHRTLVIGLLNNSPDHAFRATERRFTRALQDAAPDRDIRVQSYALPEISRDFRSDHAYLPADMLRVARPDGLVISGAEPSSPDFRQEPYWQSLTEIIDWARAQHVPTILSCLAAHAAVYHVAGVQRRRLASKCSGVFMLRKRVGHRLLGDITGPLYAPHSRWNDLPEDALLDAGYRILTSSAEAGVDMFLDPRDDAVLYFNGHPEYEAGTLMREYCRDIMRVCEGRQGSYPDMPHMAIDPVHYAGFDIIRSLVDKGHAEAAIELIRGLDTATVTARPWHALAMSVFGSWLDHVYRYAA